MLKRFFTPTVEVSAHCDLPCGVYDPAQARIEAESVKAIIAKVADKPKTAAAQMLPGPARANRAIFFAAQRGRKKAASLSVAQVHEKFEAMMSTRGSRYQNVRAVSGIMAYADAAAGTATQ